MIPDVGLSLGTRRERVGVRLVARGELDYATAGDLLAAARRARVGSPRLVVDLHELAFIDSSGLGVLLNLAGECRRAGVAFRVEAGDGPVRRALETTGLDDLLRH